MRPRTRWQPPRRVYSSNRESKELAMNRTVAIVPALLALSAAAFAQQSTAVPPELLALQRDDWGCKVLLCLANPDGPTAVSECRPPIERLWDHLKRGGSFPTCDLADGPNGRSYASPGYSRYDACPDGTTEVAAGKTVMLAAAMPATATPSGYRSGISSSYTRAQTGYGYVGIGEGDQRFGYISTSYGSGPAVKVCVAGYRGTKTIRDENDAPLEVAEYDTIFIEQPQRSPRFIDVYVDNDVWQRVRW